jgi:hypothetical protein
VGDYRQGDLVVRGGDPEPKQSATFSPADPGTFTPDVNKAGRTRASTAIPASGPATAPYAQLGRDLRQFDSRTANCAVLAVPNVSIEVHRAARALDSALRGPEPCWRANGSKGGYDNYQLLDPVERHKTSPRSTRHEQSIRGLIH